MHRVYDDIIKKQLEEDSIMVFLSGPRQVGKTTSSRQSASSISNKVFYFNWDLEEHQNAILAGQATIAKLSKIDELIEQKPTIIFDEIHKFPLWKNFIKGFYDAYHEQAHIIVTGSGRLDVYKKGGDSLMGRYFSYRMHPLSIAECLGSSFQEQEIRPPQPCPPVLLQQLLKFGGFPMPFLKHNALFSRRWQNLRLKQLIREDIRDLTSIMGINQLEILAKLIIQQAGSATSYSSLANKIKTSVETVTRWIEVLESFYFCFLIRPWSRNITRSLIKEPKIFLYDWSLISDPGSKAENFIASHLLKAVHYWNDIGLGDYGLYYLRDLDKREVDFVVTKNDQPWFIVEVKKSDNHGISKNLYYFYEEAQPDHAFQIVIEKPYINKDCFETKTPTIIPALTFLSQLI